MVCVNDDALLESEATELAEQVARALGTSLKHYMPLSRQAAIKTCREIVARLLAERDAIDESGFTLAMCNFMHEACVALAGAVPTPEKGYLVDGGFSQLLADIKTLRKQRDEAIARTNQ